MNNAENSSHTCQHSHENSNEHPGVFSHSLALQLEKGISGSELTNCLAAWVKDLLQWASENHYFIGHIKTFTSSESTLNLWLASTGKEVNINSSPGWQESIITSFNLNMTVIIFGPDKETLQKIALENLHKKLGLGSIR